MGLGNPVSNLQRAIGGTEETARKKASEETQHRTKSQETARPLATANTKHNKRAQRKTEKHYIKHKLEPPTLALHRLKDQHHNTAEDGQ